MTFYFNAYSTPLLFGFVQGWVYAILLWVRGRREERLSDILLGWVLVGCCFNIWEYMLGFGGMEFLWRELEFFPRSLGFLFPPLCYFYLKSQFNADFRFTRQDLWHAVPFLIDSGYHVIVYLQGSAFVEHWKQTVHFPYRIPEFTFIAYEVLCLYYLYQSLKLYREYQAWTKTQFSDTETISFSWFRNFIVALTVSMIVSLVVTVLDIWLNLTYWQDWWDELFGAILIYYVSITGYAQLQPARRLTFQAIIGDKDPVVNPIPDLLIQKVDSAQKISVGMADISEWKQKLLTIMTTDKPYLEPELSLADLARRLHTNPSILSQIINTGTGKNFNDFVNEYRVEEFKRQVNNPANKHLSLLGIALDCGFNSKATFNRAFKKFVNISPKEYVEQQSLDGQTIEASAKQHT